MKIIRKIFNFIDFITNSLAAIALALTFALVFLNVVTRYIFDTGFSWSEEAARYALMAIVIFGIIRVTHHREHFSVDLITKAVPPVLQRILLLAQDLIMIWIDYILIVGSYKMVALNWENTSPALAIPSWFPYGFLLFTAVISMLYLITHVLMDLNIIKAEELPEGGK